MSDEYNPVDITKDAVRFSRSRFGMHYLARLHKARERALTDAVNIDMPSEWCGKRAAQADAVQKEIDYFKTAEIIANDETMMQRLRNKVRSKEPEIEL